MKKLLFGMTSLALLFMFVLGGCSQPTDFTNTNKADSIPGPSGFTALTKYKGSDGKDADLQGMVILTWNAVKDAAGYKVIRYDTVAKVSTVLTSTAKGYSNDQTKELYFVDSVAWDNQLVDGRAYDYTVISMTSRSSAQNSTGVGGELAIIQNGEAKASAKPVIPKREDFAVDLSTLNLDISQAGSNVVLLFDTKPNYKYTISYNYGQGDAFVIPVSSVYSATSTATSYDSSSSAWYKTSTGDILNAKKKVSLPLMGGFASISVSASFNGTDDWYQVDATEIKNTNFAWKSLNAIQSFSVTYEGSTAKLKWKDDFGPDATYVVWKADVDNAAVKNVTKNWRQATLGTSTKYNAETNTWTATDSGTTTDAIDNKQVCLYVIIGSVKDGDETLTSPGYITKVDPATLADVITNFRIVDKSGSGKPKELQALWNTNDSGATYLLQWAPVEGDPTPGQVLQANLPDFEPTYKDKKFAADATEILMGKGVYDIPVTDLKPGTAYIFKLTGEKDALTETMYYVYNDKAYKFGTSFTLSNAGGVSGPSLTAGSYAQGNTNDFTAGNAIRLKLSANGSFTEGVKYKVYLYARVSSNPAIPFTLLKTDATKGITIPTEIPENYIAFSEMSPTAQSDLTAAKGVDPTLFFIHGDLSVDTRYQYRLVVKSSDDSVVMQDQTWYSGYDNESTGNGYTGSSYTSDGVQVIGQNATASVDQYYNDYGVLAGQAATNKLAKNVIVLNGSNLAGLDVEVKYELPPTGTATENSKITTVLTIASTSFDANLVNGAVPNPIAGYVPNYQVIYYVTPGLTDTNYTNKLNTSIKFVHSNGSFSGSTSW